MRKKLDVARDKIPRKTGTLLRKMKNLERKSNLIVDSKKVQNCWPTEPLSGSSSFHFSTTFSLREVFARFFISLIRMRSKRDIKMGRLCTPGGAVLGIVGGGVRFRFLNGEVIFEEYMLFWVRLYALVVVLKILLDFSL